MADDWWEQYEIQNDQRLRELHGDHYLSSNDISRNSGGKYVCNLCWKQLTDLGRVLEHVITPKHVNKVEWRKRTLPPLPPHDPPGLLAPPPPPSPSVHTSLAASAASSGLVGDSFPASIGGWPGLETDSPFPVVCPQHFELHARVQAHSFDPWCDGACGPVIGQRGNLITVRLEQPVGEMRLADKVASAASQSRVPRASEQDEAEEACPEAPRVCLQGHQLPPGRTQHTAPSGETFHHLAAEGRSQWEFPSERFPPPQPPLEWTAHAPAQAGSGTQVPQPTAERCHPTTPSAATAERQTPAKEPQAVLKPETEVLDSVDIDVSLHKRPTDELRAMVCERGIPQAKTLEREELKEALRLVKMWNKMDTQEIVGYARVFGLDLWAEGLVGSLAERLTVQFYPALPGTG